MSKFLSFLASAGQKGLASVILSAVLLVISTYEHARDKNVISYIFVVIAALVFCFGAFIAWLEENKKYEAEKAKHEEPNFIMRIESIITTYSSEQNVTTICFAADVTNRGAPSRASGWHMRYQSHSVDITVKFLSLPQERLEFPEIGGKKLVLKRMDLLPARSLVAINRGDAVHGRVLFEVPGDRRQEIYSGSAVAWLGCYDNAGRLCQEMFKATPEIPDLRAYPDEEVA